ncbi:MAG: hypothetical protein LBH68_04195 [Bifidobacteriaceae bacterium]|jgi:hypothetical protein|nr:hypothetical protein [Bifidobacteriaceae bacterium]
MSQDLIVRFSDASEFTPERWAAYMKKFGLTVSFPQGAGLADQVGFLPVDAAGLTSSETVQTGFVMDAYAPEEAGEPWFVAFSSSAGEGDEVWALAHAAAAYFVAELEAGLEDPQEGTEYGPGDLPQLEALVEELLDGVRGD